MCPGAAGTEIVINEAVHPCSHGGLEWDLVGALVEGRWRNSSATVHKLHAVHTSGRYMHMYMHMYYMHMYMLLQC